LNLNLRGTEMSEISSLNRYRGALVGVHTGDALGAPYETWGAKKIAEDIKIRGGLIFFDYEDPWKHEPEPKILPAGRPTDDSDQTADLASSLIECNGLNTGHLREALRDSVIRHKSRLWDGTALGAGGTTRKALSDDPEKVKAAMQNNIGTNGSLMRCVPLILYYYEHDDIDEKISAMSAVTHAHPHSIEACMFYAECLEEILQGKSKEVIFGQMDTSYDKYYLMQRVASSVADDRLFPIDPGTWPARGAAEFSLYAALWCFKHATSFADGIEKAVHIGGDTDTYAAIAGGLLGAYYGYEEIPLKWRQIILGHDVMVDYADKLYELNKIK
jgi:ADP-ribosyl-[dinitrogen reductase] hydrolase